MRVGLAVLAGAGCGRLRFDDAAPDGAPDGPAVPPGAAIIFHFDEDGGPATASEDGLVASLVGGVAWVPGVRGSGVEIGASSYIDVPPRDDLALAGAVTVSIWYRPYVTLATNQCAPLVIHAGASDTDPADNALYALNLVPPLLVLFAERGDQQSAETDATAPAGAFSADDWHHLVVVRDAAPNVTFYLDGGAAIAAPSPQPADGGAAGHLRIGGDIAPPPEGCESFPGSLDELYVYPRALDAAEVQMLFAAR